MGDSGTTTSADDFCRASEKLSEHFSAIRSGPPVTKDLPEAFRRLAIKRMGDTGDRFALPFATRTIRDLLSDHFHDLAYRPALQSWLRERSGQPNADDFKVGILLEDSCIVIDIGFVPPRFVVDRKYTECAVLLLCAAK